MTSLEISMTDATDTPIAVGAIFTSNAKDNDPPRVSHVIVRPSFSSRFMLPTGSWAYVFHVEGDGGKFTLQVEQDGNPAPLKSTSIDTADGFFHRVIRFEVP